MANSESQPILRYMMAGIIAGPFFIVVALLQAFTRQGFDWVRHPASMLSLGELGWIQIANFVLTGIFFILCGIGLSGVLKEGIGRKWVSRLFVLFGVALIMGGVFTPDPGLGFPLGAPEGPAKEMSWHSIIHGFAPILGFTSQTAALIILAKRFGSQEKKVLKFLTIVVAVAMFGLAVVPNFTADWEKGVFNFLPLWAAVALGYGWTSVVIAKVRAEAQSGAV